MVISNLREPTGGDLGAKDLEVEPLGMALGVDVVLEPEVVLDVVHLDGPAEVPTLESGVEDEDIVLLGHAYRVCPRQGKLPLLLKLGQVLEQELVEFILEVSLPRLPVEQLVRFPCLLPAEQPGEIDA